MPDASLYDAPPGDDRLLPPTRAPLGLIRIEPLLATAAIGAGLFFDGFDSAEGRAISAILSAALFAFLLLVRRPGLGWWGHVAPVLVLAVAGGGWLLIGAAVDPATHLAPDMAEARLLGAGAGFLALLCGCLIAYARGSTVRIVDLWTRLAMLSVVAAAAIATGMIGEDPSSAWRHERFIGLIGNANVMAAMCGCIALLALARGLSLARRGSAAGAARLRGRPPELVILPGDPAPPRGGAARVLHAAVAVGAIAALLATGSRFPVALTLVLAVGIVIRGLLRGRRRRTALLATAVVGVAGLIAASYLSDVLLDRLDDLSSGSAPRSAMWARYLDAVERSPWFGYGPGGFSSLNAATLGDPFAAQGMWTLNSPHNVLFQLLLEGGVPYLLLTVLACLFVLWPVLRYFRAERRSIEAAGLAAATALIFGCALADIVLDTPVGAMTALFFAGLLWGEALAVT